MTLLEQHRFLATRRHFLGQSAGAVGLAALAGLLGKYAASASPGLPGVPHFAGKAKRVIYLCQSGGPSHLELLDYKPRLRALHGTELPASIRMGQRLTGMTSGQASFPVIAPPFRFHRQGRSGAWLSELLPHTGRIVD